MLGKDYMLAIIIVNYEDNLWNDQDLDLDSDLPPGWRTIRDSTGKYYWHTPTGATQWQHPAYGSEDDQNTATSSQKRLRSIESPLSSVNDSSQAQPCLRPTDIAAKDSLAWSGNYSSNVDPDSKQCFTVRSLGWVEVPEEELVPGKSSIAVNNCIQQLSHSKCDGRDAVGAWGEGLDMVMVLKKDTLSLVDPLDHSLIHCQLIVNIRVWGVGCNNGRDFAFVACDKDTCTLKCHVFRCDVPAKAIATALHKLYSKIVAEKASMHSSVSHSFTEEDISPEDLPLHVGFMDAMRHRVQKFQVQYVGNLPVSRAMGMDVLNRAIETVMDTTEREEWEPIDIHVTETTLSLWNGQGDGVPFWECQVRYLTFLGVGQDTHTFGVIVDTGTQQFECHVFWCEPDAGTISEAVQAACMVQYQKCLVSQTPPLKSKMIWGGAKLKRAASMDISAYESHFHGPSSPKFAGSSGVRRGMLSFLGTFRSKQTAGPAP